MRDDEDNGDAQARELFEALGERFGTVTERRSLTEGQREVLRRAERIHRSLVRPEGEGPAAGEFPSTDDIRLHNIEPGEVRRGDTVTIFGKDLYGVRSVRVGRARAPIVRRGEDHDAQRETLEIVIPENARDGTVRVNGQLVEFELKLLDDEDDWRAS